MVLSQRNLLLRAGRSASLPFLALANESPLSAGLLRIARFGTVRRQRSEAAWAADQCSVPHQFSACAGGMEARSRPSHIVGL